MRQSGVVCLGPEARELQEGEGAVYHEAVLASVMRDVWHGMLQAR